MKGLLAQKVGMTRVIDPESGVVTPVTVLQVPKATVLQVKTVAKDGYQALVLGSFPRKHFGKNENKKYKQIREIGLEEGQEVKKGDEIGLEQFEGIEKIQLQGTSKGRGFAGVIKRHNFSRGPETHGSHHHREPGSIGMCAKPARVLKGKKMPGRMGHDSVTLRDVPVMSLQADKNLLAVKGPIPGAKNSYVFITA